MRRERRVSHTVPDLDLMDEHYVNATGVLISMGSDSSGASKDKSPERSAPNQLNSGFSAIRELQITPEPDEKIGSDFESDDQDFNQEKQENDDDINLEQSSVPAQLPYIEVQESLHTHLGPKLCPEEVPEDHAKSGASASNFFNKKSKVPVHLALPHSRLILEVVEKISSRIQGANSTKALHNYPKGMETNRFPSLYMKPKVFSQDSYKITDPTLELSAPCPAPL